VREQRALDLPAFRYQRADPLPLAAALRPARSEQTGEPLTAAAAGTSADLGRGAGARRAANAPRAYPRWGKDKLAVLLWGAGRTVAVSMVGRILTRLKRRGLLVEPVSNTISARKPVPPPAPVGVAAARAQAQRRGRARSAHAHRGVL